MSGSFDVLKGARLVVSGVAYRSDAVVPGDVFFCIPGFVHDGHDFAHDAVSRGAVAVVAQRPIDGLGPVPLILVENARIALAQASSRLFNTPSSQLDVIGITGTNGKTTTTYILDSVMRAAGRTTGVIGTV
ncbi:MAG: Mur ligase domain-containing protein, partial [Coriobacteriia bacterium]|nr:Mur ligase domain-containing protein [Coriobacteriia bacterium]